MGEACTAVKDEKIVVGQTNLEARRVSAISKILRKGSWRRSTDAPESQLHPPGIHWVSSRMELAMNRLTLLKRLEHQRNRRSVRPISRGGIIVAFPLHTAW